MVGGGVVDDVNINISMLLLMLDECRVGVELMSRIQGSQRVLKNRFARTCKNELSAQRLTNKGDKERIVQVKGTSQWICVY